MISLWEKGFIILSLEQTFPFSIRELVNIYQHANHFLEASRKLYQLINGEDVPRDGLQIEKIKFFKTGFEPIIEN